MVLDHLSYQGPCIHRAYQKAELNNYEEALFPGPFAGEGKMAWYRLFAHAWIFRLFYIVNFSDTQELNLSAWDIPIECIVGYEVQHQHNSFNNGKHSVFYRFVKPRRQPSKKRHVRHKHSGWLRVTLFRDIVNLLERKHVLRKNEVTHRNTISLGTKLN